MAARDYRKHLRRSVLGVFFGILAAAIAPDLGLGLKPFFVLGGALAVSVSAFWLASLPVKRAFRVLMIPCGVLAFLYAALAGLALARGEGETAGRMALLAKGLGALSLFCVSAALEILCRRLKWLRLERGWVFTEGAVGLAYCLPALGGWFWGYFGRYFDAWRFVATLKYEISGFDFHGMRVPGIVGGSRWLVLLLLALLTPTVMMLVNLLRTYAQVASPPPPPDDSQPIEWSRR
jgi:hypothetical protein